MKIRTLSTAAAVLVAGTLGLTACGGSSSNSSSPAATAAASQASPSDSVSASASDSASASASDSASSSSTMSASVSASASGSASGSASAAAATTVDPNKASKEEIAAALKANGVKNSDKWSNEIEEYKGDVGGYTQANLAPTLKKELAKYNIAPDQLALILATLKLS